MTAKIQPLPAEVVNLIAAGEVIDSLAAVVRELAENALDAQATRIVINIFPELWRIQISDNGSGMDLEDLRQAALPHSTSKIHNSDDLWHINSLGFRGEALHSLAQLANLEICSRTAHEEAGWRVTYSQNQTKVETVAIALGTIITVSDLFANWPARRQALPSLSQQLKLIQLVIQHLALCHPQVTWQVRQDHKPWFCITPVANAQKILPQILRDVRANDLQYYQTEISDVPDQSNRTNGVSQLELVIGLPDRCHRHRPDWVKVAVNGRIVKLAEIESTILGSFQRTLPRERFPVCFLHLQITPTQIDWNRHPAKAEIYLQNLGFWQTQISTAISEALRLSAVDLSASKPGQRVQDLLKASAAKGNYNINDLEGQDEHQLGAENPASKLINIKAIAQVHNMYILVEHPDGVWLIEQHIAHERVLYEELCDRWQLVPLEPPIILTNLSTSQVEQLKRIGLDIEPFGEQLHTVRTAPEILVKRDDCADALRELSLGGDLQSAQVMTACRSAIKNGKILSLTEMQDLLEQWQKTRNPRTCPHGRPICLSLEETSLSRFFRRHWVIGKSHGI